jgi:hypothetical protein
MSAYDPEEFRSKVKAYLAELEDMLVLKNSAYGDSALNPVRIFSKASAIEQINVRIDDKLKRIHNGDKSEDVEKDLTGYLILKRIKERE